MRSAFTTVLEGLARINVIRRFSAQKASDQGKVETYLQRELVKIRDSFRELPDRSQQLEESTLERVLYPIVALADVYAGEIMLIEGQNAPPPAPAAPVRAPPPPVRAVPPPHPGPVPPPVQGPPAAAPPRVGQAPAPAPAEAPVIPQARMGAFEWASILELQEYGTNIAGKRVPDNIELILKDELPKLGRIINGQRHDQITRRLNERDEKIEAYAYWFVLRLGFMEAEKAEPLARKLRRRFPEYKPSPSLLPPPSVEKSAKASGELLALQALAPAFVVLAGLFCMYLLHVDQRNSAQAFERVLHGPEQR